MDDQIHHAELEAYKAFLRALCLRKDDISWELELFMTDMRKDGQKVIEPPPGNEFSFPTCENEEQTILLDPQSERPSIPREAEGQQVTQISDASEEPSEIRCLGVGNDIIKILDTNSLLQEVSSILASSNADPARLALAKNLLQDQERALTDAIYKLNTLLSRDSSDSHGKH